MSAQHLDNMHGYDKCVYVGTIISVHCAGSSQGNASGGLLLTNTKGVFSHEDGIVSVKYFPDTERMNCCLWAKHSAKVNRQTLAHLTTDTSGNRQTLAHLVTGWQSEGRSSSGSFTTDLPRNASPRILRNAFSHTSTVQWHSVRRFHYPLDYCLFQIQQLNRSFPTIAALKLPTTSLRSTQHVTNGSRMSWDLASFRNSVWQLSEFLSTLWLCIPQSFLCLTISCPVTLLLHITIRHGRLMRLCNISTRRDC